MLRRRRRRKRRREMSAVQRERVRARHTLDRQLGDSPKTLITKRNGGGGDGCGEQADVDSDERSFFCFLLRAR